MRLRSVLFVSLAMLGCGLDGGGDGVDIPLPDGDAPDAQGPDTGPTPDANVEDASVQDATMQDATMQDAGPDASVVDSSVADSSVADSSVVDAGPCTQNQNACASLNLPNIWSPIAFHAAGALSCPMGFNTPQNPVTSPVATPAACTCAATQNTYACSTGAETLMYDPPGSSCATTSNTPINFSGVSSSCVNAGGAIPSAVQVTALGLSGSCKAAATLDTTKVSATTTTTCQPVCKDDVCAGAVPQGWAACIVAAGAQSCPAPFNTKYTVGDAATATCASTCACSQPTCGTPTVTFYQTQNCNSFVEAVTGTNCTSMSQKGNGYASVKYSSTLSAVTFGTSAPTASVTNGKTVCCR